MIFRILQTSFLMFWEVLWPLIFGFLISAVVQSIVLRRHLSKLLGKDNLRCFTLSALFGIASSSCSYAAVAIARSLFRKGATFTNAMIFELASTNLVIELGIILFILMGWQFVAAEFIGGVIMIVLVSFIFRLTLNKTLIHSAKKQAEKGLMGKMEGHAQMEMGRGFTSVSHYFVMDWVSVLSDLVLGFLIAGILAVLVPQTFWDIFFAKNNPTMAFLIGPLVGPLIAIISFVCSVGNVPLAAVLWQGGISFGGVVSFIFADLIVLPILNIYRKYYGWKTMLYILVTFYAAMAISGYTTEILFAFFGIIPTERAIVSMAGGISWNYTSVLNIMFVGIGVILLLRFFKTKGVEMIRMMG